MKTTQKHITGIKSVFGGIKNWWNGDKEKETSRPTDQGSSDLRTTVDKHNASQPHPGERFKSDDGRGFYEEEEDLDSQFMKGSRNPAGKQYFTPVTNSAKEQRLNENLGW